MRKTKTDIVSERNDRTEKYKALCRDYAEVFKSKQGMRVLNDILSKGFLYTTTCYGNKDGMDGFREGKRDHALYIMKRTNTGDSNVMINIMRDNQELKLEREAK